ncbi:Monogalactosyldiacylglycerol synthase [Forsythia ovata]|uniref:Monogalactosyldiacylglycerol synthase n=1 Tax=Forsythia ovata TaxID=205694 RepID=A0ABD1UCY1_9LAMI
MEWQNKLLCSAKLTTSKWTQLHLRHDRDGHSAFLTNYLYFDTEKKSKALASLSLSTKGSAYRFRNVLNQFNRAIKFHCERIPLSFFEDRVNSEENNGFKNNGHGFLEDSEAIKAAFMEEYGCSTIPRRF